MINKTLDLGIPEPEETYSSSEHFYEQLDIPRTAKGRLPRAAQKLAGLGAEVLEDLGETGKSGGRRPGASGPSRDGGGRDSSRGRDGGSRDSGSRGRDGSREGGRGGERRTDSAPTEGGDAAAKPRRNRNRRRTRGGADAGEASSTQA
jgi:hypothetical protein